ncbi:MAG: carboxylating nicotinate-nucleotide diphosphorylase [Phycisphaerae bacterium]
MPQPTQHPTDQIDIAQLDSLIKLAVDEDLGCSGDITTRLLVGTARPRSYALLAGQQGLFAGKVLLPALLRRLTPEGRIVQIDDRPDGFAVQPGQQIAVIEAPPPQMLAAERIVLNFLGRLSGIASLTARFVAAVAGTPARIFDTRKTIPGWRRLDKYAVRCGGGHNHRMGLFDALLIKDNHLADIKPDELASTVAAAVQQAASLHPPPAFLEVEVDTLAHLEQLLPVSGIDIFLLDNFSPDQLRQAVALRDAAGLAGRVELEASGGITLENVRLFAETGVERISVGALTHAAPALDLSLQAL